MFLLNNALEANPSLALQFTEDTQTLEEMQHTILRREGNGGLRGTAVCRVS